MADTTTRLMEALEDEHALLCETLEKRAMELKFMLPFSGHHKSAIEYEGILKLLTALRIAFGNPNNK